MARYWISTSGWSYANWRGAFYPRGLRSGDWLGYYARHLASVEINATFYRPPRPAMLAGWAEKTPADFVFAVKVWRAISHFKRLRGCDQALADFLERIRPLGAKAGPLLIQLPPRFARDPERLAAFLAMVPRGRRFAFEFRDPSWHTDEIFELLARHNAAFCPFELGGARAPRVATADFVYVRLHGPAAPYQGAYTEAALRDWAGWLRARMAEGRDAYVYFDNTDEANHAVRDAMALARLMASPPETNI